MRPLLPTVLLCAALTSSTYAQTDTEAEITALIEAVRESGCEFNRNGSLHSAGAAAEHLELKYSRGKRYADSAEAFIERLASKSSWSGKPYEMICDGETQPAGYWLTATLVALRDQ